MEAKKLSKKDNKNIRILLSTISLFSPGHSPSPCRPTILHGLEVYKLLRKNPSFFFFPSSLQLANMPIRQMKEGLEQHLVIKFIKLPKLVIISRGLRPKNMISYSTMNRSRRRSRGAKKNAQCDELSFMRPPKADGCRIPNGCLEKEGPTCHSEAGIPSSSKSLRFPARPGFGQISAYAGILKLIFKQFMLMMTSKERYL